MSQRTHPPFRANVVGSLLRPPALLEAREQHKKGAISGETLRQLEDAAIRDAIKLQEDTGLQVATDGEYCSASASSASYRARRAASSSRISHT